MKALVAGTFTLAACGAPRDTPATQPSPPACQLAGDYRLRVGDPAETFVWWHLGIRDGRIARASPSELTRYRVTLDAARCTIVATTNEATYDPTVLELALDAKTGMVTGRASGAHVSNHDPVPITGERVAAQPEVPGVFTLASDAQWTCDPPSRAVGMYTPFQLFALRVQPFQGTIVIDRVEPTPPHDPMIGDVSVVRTGCDVRLTTTYGRRMTALLTFRGDTFDGTVAEMEYGGGDSGGGWQCRVAGAKLAGTRVR